MTAPDGAKLLQVAYEELLLASCFGHLAVAVDEDKRTELRAFTDLPFDEAISYFRAKQIVDRSTFRAMSDTARLEAFNVAGLNTRYALERTHAALTDAIAEGVSKKAFIKAAPELWQSFGLVPSSRHHLETVFDTNVLGAYQRGRWTQLQAVKARRPLWQYVTVGDANVRPTHAAHDGKVRRADDDFWLRNYPPNGFRCRCDVHSLTEEEAAAEGLQVEQAPSAGDAADKGWRGSPGLAERGRAAAQKLRREVVKLGVLQPPRLADGATSAGRPKARSAYTSAGDLDRAQDRRRARLVDKLAGLSAGRARSLVREQARFSVARKPPRVARGAQAVEVPITSQDLDSAEQWLDRLASDPATAKLASKARLYARASYAAATEGAPATSAVTGGIARSTEIVLHVPVRAVTPELLEVARMAQAGEGAVRRAPAAAPVMIRGARLKPRPGWERAYLNRRRLSGAEQQVVSAEQLGAGWTSDPILVTSEYLESLTR